MKKFFGIFTDILLVFLIFILIFNVFSIFYSKKNDTKDNFRFFSYMFYIDASNSMSPTINKGDLIVAKAVDISSLKIGDIIVFHDDENDVSVTHRIVNILSVDGELKIETKGDKNSSEDLQLVSKENLEAKYIFKIAGLGYILLFLTTINGMLVLGLIVLVIFLFSYLVSIF